MKALPNPWIVRIAGEEGLGADCSSLPELILSERVGLRGEDLMFTSNNTLAHEYRKAVQLGAIVNLDDLTHIDYLREHVGLPELLCFRYNPGSAREGNVIIGKPEEAKYGFTEQQLFEGYRRLRDAGVQRFGLHTMVASTPTASANANSASSRLGSPGTSGPLQARKTSPGSRCWRRPVVRSQCAAPRPAMP